MAEARQSLEFDDGLTGAVSNILETKRGLLRTCIRPARRGRYGGGRTRGCWIIR